MSAPTLESFFQVENAVENAVRAFLAQEEIPATVPHGDEVLATPRVEVELVLGAVTGHRGYYHGLAVHDTWDGVLIFRTVTNRQKNVAAHKAFRGKIRYLVQPAFGKFTLQNLPLHVVSVVAEAGTSIKVDDELGHDVSELHIKVIISIRTSAWEQVQ